VFKKIIFFIVSSLNFFFSNYTKKVFLYLAHVINQSGCGKDFVTVHFRPKYSEDVHKRESFLEEVKLPAFAIMIQGPIVLKNNFTFETIQLYRKLFGESVIIVFSSWHGELSDEKILDLESYCSVVLSEKPTNSGLHNVNYQIVSSRCGMLKAKELGAEFLIKTRSDQRFYNPATLKILHNLYMTAPNKIIELSMSSCKYRPWSLCDMFQFSKADILLDMWNIELDERKKYKINFHDESYRVRDIVSAKIAEIYVHFNHANKYGYYDVLSVDDYYSYIREKIIIIDKEVIDIFWYKYTAKEYCLVGSDFYSSEDVLSMISWGDYLLILDGCPSKKTYEYLDEYEKI
tara:strand:- start:73125 stop:74162 length:1038 start_codon:yes stop_codon:yes gene_type:complete